MKSQILMLAMCFAFLSTATLNGQELTVGLKAPDFEVTTFGDKKVTLSEQKKPTVLLFSRASW